MSFWKLEKSFSFYFPPLLTAKFHKVVGTVFCFKPCGKEVCNTNFPFFIFIFFVVRVLLCSSCLFRPFWLPNRFSRETANQKNREGQNPSSPKSRTKKPINIPRFPLLSLPPPQKKNSLHHETGKRPLPHTKPPGRTDPRRQTKRGPPPTASSDYPKGDTVVLLFSAIRFYGWENKLREKIVKKISLWAVPFQIKIAVALRASSNSISKNDTT